MHNKFYKENIDKVRESVGIFKKYVSRCDRCGEEKIYKHFGYNEYETPRSTCLRCEEELRKEEELCKEKEFQIEKYQLRQKVAEEMKLSGLTKVKSPIPYLTEEEYNALFVKQNGCCAICEVHQDKFGKRLARDHNHDTGEMRGLLCAACNTALGLIKENKVTLLNMIDYINQHNF